MSITIEEIACSSQWGPCNNQVSSYFDSLEGKNIFKTKKLINSYFEENSSVVNFSIQYQIPNKYKVNVIERSPHFALFFVNHNKNVLSLVDFEGYVLAFQETSSFPLVETTKTPANVGEKVDSRTLFSLEIVGYLKDFYEIEKGVITNESLEVTFKNGIKVLFPTVGDKELLVSSLGVILTKLNSGEVDSNIDIDSINTIDLRFNNPVLR